VVCPVTPDEDFNIAMVVFIVLVVVTLGFTAGNRQEKLDSSNMSEKPNSSTKER